MLSEIDLLIGYQRAEFDAASSLRGWLIICQFMIALSIAGSVFTDEHSALLYLALAALGLSVIYISLDRRYEDHRALAERARRLTLIYGGLCGDQIDQSELLDLKSSFLVSEERAVKSFKPGYFASKLPSGACRLGEMLEESSFWTCKLQSLSAWHMGIIAGGFVAIGIFAFWGLVPTSDREVQITVVRVVLALIAFVLSSDVWGAVFGHINLSQEARRIQMKLGALRAKGYPMPDLMIVLNDYNAATQAAPLSVPWAYKFSQERLNTLWAQYEASKG
jgi:hypothetical protein